MNLQAALSVLQVRKLRGKQREAIDSIVNGVDTIYIFPTGTGKTLVYEAAALCSSGNNFITHVGKLFM